MNSACVALNNVCDSNAAGGVTTCNSGGTLPGSTDPNANIGD